jgi:hypothetical protein
MEKSERPITRATANAGAKTLCISNKTYYQGNLLKLLIKVIPRR